MRAWLGVTDWDWYEKLRSIGATEVNFWQPSGGRRFNALEPGGPFLFKTHYSGGNRIVGGGFFSGWAALPLSMAWDLFGEANGCSTLEEMQARVQRYRRSAADVANDPEIGCIMLDAVRYFSPGEAPPAPPGWSPNIVQGRGYELGVDEGQYVEEVFHSLLAGAVAEPLGSGVDLDWHASQVEGPVFSGTRPTPVRVGQRAFKALVQETYGRRCAVTGDRIVPVLEAAHIKPVSCQGENRLDNGLLLRSDVHTLLDRGYLAVHPDRRTLLVSPRLRSRWGNGEEFYARAASGDPIREPKRAVDRPNREFLTWHADTVFLSS